MESTIKNRVVYSAASSIAIGEAASQQRLAYNTAVDYILAHPNTSNYDLQKELTKWRDKNPSKWHGHLRVQRPGLQMGADAVRGFDKASINTLKECEKEIKWREKKNAPSRRNTPKHPVRPGRSLDTTRLHKRRKAPITLRVEDKKAIKLHDTRRLTVAGINLKLAKPVPVDAKVVAVHIKERDSSIRKGRNRPLEERSYRINLIWQLPDAPDKVPWDNPLGLDVGVVNTLTRSDYRPAKQPDTSLPEQVKLLKEEQKRLKRGGRQWAKLQKRIRVLRRRHRNRLDNWEHHIAKDIAERHSLVSVEDLKLNNMRRSAQGTPEQHGSRVTQKTALNRSMAQARPGELLKKIERHCEKTGTWFTRVPPAHTSTTCPICGCRARRNRKNQAEFSCTGCGLEANADAVAGNNCRILGIKALTLMLLLWAHGPEKQAASIRRRQGLPPLGDSLSLLVGRTSRKVSPNRTDGPALKKLDLSRGRDAGSQTLRRPTSSEPKRLKTARS